MADGSLGGSGRGGRPGVSDGSFPCLAVVPTAAAPSVASAAINVTSVSLNNSGGPPGVPHAGL